jgi:beta-glucosidase
MPTATFHFPKDFRWGTATAAHQVEGNNTNNQWWVWEQQPGRIENGDRSGQACDWWNGTDADFDRMAAMGLNAHRLSVEWSRIEPREGVFDHAAIDRYRQMLRGLRQRGIEPMVTLHHFTNPIWLDERGGMLNPELAIPAFERFVERTVTALDDLCDLWCTINEPNVFAVMSYMGGRMPPGMQGSIEDALRVVCGMLAMHTVAAQAIRRAQGRARIGFAHHMRVFEAMRKNNPLDAIAARVQDLLFNDALLKTLLSGRWHLALRRFAPSGVKLAANTLDWIGLNYYTRQATRFDGGGSQTGYGTIENFPGAVMSDFNYGELYPAGLMKMLRRLHKTRLPIYITENGIPDHDDDQRPGFLVTHLREVWKAIQYCFDVRGYYHWSFVDNFEWSEGWRMRFGLYAMDEKTGERTLRPSGALYGEIARANALSVEMAERYAPETARHLFPQL